MTLRILVAVLALVLLAGCGDAEQARRDAYCRTLQAKQAVFGDLENGDDPAALVDRLPTLEQIGATSPDDLSDEWQTFLTALRTLDRAIRAAHVRPGQFGPGKVPPGLTKAQLGAIRDAASDLASPDVVSAADGIEQQARDVCHLQLGL